MRARSRKRNAFCIQMSGRRKKTSVCYRGSVNCDSGTICKRDQNQSKLIVETIFKSSGLCRPRRGPIASLLRSPAGEAWTNGFSTCWPTIRNIDCKYEIRRNAAAWLNTRAVAMEQLGSIAAQYENCHEKLLSTKLSCLKNTMRRTSWDILKYLETPTVCLVDYIN